MNQHELIPQIFYESSWKIKVGTGSCLDDTRKTWIVVVYPFTIDLRTSGAGGLDTGSLLNSAWYYPWLIYTGDYEDTIVKKEIRKRKKISRRDPPEWGTHWVGWETVEIEETRLPPLQRTIVSAVFSRSPEEPVLPSGFRCKRRLGSIYVQDDCTIRNFVQLKSSPYNFSGGLT